MTDQQPASRSIYLGLFFLCMATLMYEILLTRIFSVIMWYHFAFMAVSVAMFGMTVGAILVYLFPSKFAASRVCLLLAVNSWLFALSMLISFVIEISIPVYISEITTLVSFTYVITLIPFIFSGICVSLVLTRFPGQLSKLYATDLAGAAVGCVLLIYLLKFTDGPTAVIALSAIVSISAVLFIGKIKGMLSAILYMTSVVLVAFTTIHIVLVKQGNPWLRIAWAKEKKLERPLYERWNSFSRIQVRSDTDEENAQAWGMSSTYNPTRSVKELKLNIDASAATVLTQYSGDPKEVDHLKYDVTNLVHHVRRDADVLVVGMGGGRDVLSALVFDQNSVVGVEINDQILEAVNIKFGDFTGHLYKDPRVKLVNDEARSFIARQEKPFDIIQVSLIDTWAATAAGAFALSENSLYTMEAWEMFLDHLSEDGIISFSRWYSPGKSPGLYRLTSLAASVLRKAGVKNPADHIVIVASNPKQKKKSFKGVASLLVCKRAFTQEELQEVDAAAKKLEFKVLFSPQSNQERNLSNIIRQRNVPRFDFDISAPTDDKPFFFNTFTTSSIARAWRQPRLTSEANPGVVLSYLLGLAFILTILCVFLPLSLTIRRVNTEGMWPFLIFFAAIGTGFMTIEISQMQRLAIFLGHPTYSLSVVLFSLLLSTGIGSYWTASFSSTELGKKGLLCLLLLIATVSAFGVATVPIIRHFESSSNAIRILVAGLLLSPMGFFMGTAFPLGMKLASKKLPDMTPWFWGVNGATSVWASILAVFLAILWGISFSFWIGCAFYAIALLAFLRIRNPSIQA